MYLHEGGPPLPLPRLLLLALLIVLAASARAHYHPGHAKTCRYASIRDVRISGVFSGDPPAGVVQLADGDSRPDVLAITVGRPTDILVAIEYVASDARVDFAAHFGLRRAVLTPTTAGLYSTAPFVETGHVQVTGMMDDGAGAGAGEAVAREDLAPDAVEFDVPLYGQPPATPVLGPPRRCRRGKSGVSCRVLLNRAYAWLRNNTLFRRHNTTANSTQPTHVRKTVVLGVRFWVMHANLYASRTPAAMRHVFLSLFFAEPLSGRGLMLDVPPTTVFRVVEDINNLVQVPPALVKPEPLLPESERHECPVCMEPLRLNEQELAAANKSSSSKSRDRHIPTQQPLAALSKCGHVYHSSCADRIFAHAGKKAPHERPQNPRCALCRAEMVRTWSPFAQYLNMERLGGRRPIEWADLAN